MSVTLMGMTKDIGNLCEYCLFKGRELIRANIVDL